MVGKCRELLSGLVVMAAALCLQGTKAMPGSQATNATPATSSRGLGLGNNLNPTPQLFNDVGRSRYLRPRPHGRRFPASHPNCVCASGCFHLQQHRMIEVNLHPTAGDNDIPQYADRNHLGRIVSGRSRGYTSRLRGHGSYDREARAAALSFYHIHLPLSTGQVLYLSPEYVVVYVRPRPPKPIKQPPERDPDPEFGVILVDFLHDARAYDYKDQGYAERVNLTPEMLHPAAATSFADILRYKLRPLLCIVDFRGTTRGMGAPPLGGGRSHFAQTFPLRRRGHVTGAFHWLQVDPRPGVELDLRQVPSMDGPHLMLRNWRRLEHLFGVTRNQQASPENDDGCGFCLYVCPTKDWSAPNRQRMDGGHGARAWNHYWNVREMKAEAEAVWSRDELAQYLQYEVEGWDKLRLYLTREFGGTHPLPKYSSDF
ncbi:hypothetical protein N658DRAFT_516620 [Parathielavia hyrcaniae]|uniref:Uncharacterized protein n=1 Tax=Parathielavia hyrcaniae TaxID=113614 RepID=A0AAN6PZ03_9PEZI|nr:hypothetical protein N658DRAFT_516620 [Parathielavia hyrcaniae]